MILFLGHLCQGRLEEQTKDGTRIKHNVLLIALAVLLCGSVSFAQKKASSGEYIAKDSLCDIVFVERVQTTSEVLYNTRFTPSGNLFVLRRDGTLHNLTRLTTGDVSNPDVSYDGKRILFSMMKDKTDWWHVYEMQRAELLHVMDADGSNVRQISFFLSGDYNPMVLHDGRRLWMRQCLLVP